MLAPLAELDSAKDPMPFPLPLEERVTAGGPITSRLLGSPVVVKSVADVLGVAGLEGLVRVLEYGLC